MKPPSYKSTAASTWREKLAHHDYQMRSIAGEPLSQPGDKWAQERAKPVQHERAEQEALAAWVKRQWWAPFWSHIGHERWDKGEARTMHRAGVTSGILDNWLWLPSGEYVAAVSELKRPGAPKSAVSVRQRWWIRVLSTMPGPNGLAVPDAGLRRVGVHRGWDEARAFFAEYVERMSPAQETWARAMAAELRTSLDDSLAGIGGGR